MPSNNVNSKIYLQRLSVVYCVYRITRCFNIIYNGNHLYTSSDFLSEFTRLTIISMNGMKINMWSELRKFIFFFDKSENFRHKLLSEGSSISVDRFNCTGNRLGILRTMFKYNYNEQFLLILTFHFASMDWIRYLIFICIDIFYNFT